jgi:hypothetical protein
LEPAFGLEPRPATNRCQARVGGSRRIRPEGLPNVPSARVRHFRPGSVGLDVRLGASPRFAKRFSTTIAASSVSTTDASRAARIAFLASGLTPGASCGLGGESPSDHPYPQTAQCIVRPPGPMLLTVATGSLHDAHTRPVRVVFAACGMAVAHSTVRTRGALSGMPLNQWPYTERLDALCDGKACATPEIPTHGVRE